MTFIIIVLPWSVRARVWDDIFFILCKHCIFIKLFKKSTLPELMICHLEETMASSCCLLRGDHYQGLLRSVYHVPYDPIL